MKLYRIRNKSTNEFWEGEAKTASEAVLKAGWPVAVCEIKEKTYNGAGGWKKTDVRN